MQAATGELRKPFRRVWVRNQFIELHSNNNELNSPKKVKNMKFWSIKKAFVSDRHEERKIFPQKLKEKKVATTRKKFCKFLNPLSTPPFAKILKLNYGKEHILRDFLLENMFSSIQGSFILIILWAKKTKSSVISTGIACYEYAKIF